jgi:capsular polysaccharide transport system permease protein
MALAELVAPLNFQARVIAAVVRRDLRTRFGRTVFGPLILVGWPLSHALVLIALYAIVRRLSPIGTEAAVFFATGVLPYILCLYPGRMIMIFSIMANRSLLQIPIVKPFDLMAAQTVVQIIISFWVTTLFALILFIFGVDVVPQRPEEAIFAILATIYLGAAIGCLGAVLYALMRAWMAVQILTLIIMYFTSGALFVPEMLPQKLRAVIWLNPLFHCVEWFRAAYYNYYSYGMLDRSYLLSFSTIVLLFALLIERGMRGRLLGQH